MVLERRLVVTNAPDLFSPALSPEEQDVRGHFHLSRPEPHALLLVLKSGTFTEQDRDALKLINVTFGEGASEYVIVVFMHEEQEYVSTKDSDTESVKSLLKTSRRPHHHLQRNGDQSQVQKLLGSIEKMVEENGGHQLKITEEPRPFQMKEDTVCQTTNKIHKDVQKLINDCGGRFHVFNNKHKDPAQVVSLLKKIDKMMWDNDPDFYNDKMFQEAERAFRLMQINREREEEVRREIKAIKAKYESEIKEIQDQLEEEKTKGKVREFLFVEREFTLLRQERENTATTNTEQTHVERKNDDQIEKQENQLTGTTDLDREIPKPGRESDQDPKKHVKKWRGLESLKKGIKLRKKIERTEECKTKDAASGEENVEKITDRVTDQQSSEDLPKTSDDERNAEKEQLNQHYKEMEECRQKMDEAMRRYKETADMYAAERMRIEARNVQIIDSWEKDHGKSCALQ
ncbi:trichohyalin-like [Sinocyclocheilus grahami]|uniref:trichohyalin-like n=1 Tax=Sinocyclocheilus grahami TaxID=75366 RepID=UPI0007AC6C99|nr:PREDICTED: trichohyalin-like [Sinocyclocheilus grahami]